MNLITKSKTFKARIVKYLNQRKLPLTDVNIYDTMKDNE